MNECKDCLFCVFSYESFDELFSYCVKARVLTDEEFEMARNGECPRFEKSPWKG